MPEMSRFEKWFVNRGSRLARLRFLPDFLEGRLPRPAPGSAFLELGCGAGYGAMLLQDRFRPARFHVTDSDPAQVALARKNLAQRYGTIPEGMVLGTADALHLEFPPATFDLVAAILVLHHVGSHKLWRAWDAIAGALGQVDRVLKPGGAFVVAEFLWAKRIERFFLDRGYTVRGKRRMMVFARLVILQKPRS